jgi:membrane metallo-endopeptidase-like protein 1
MYVGVDEKNSLSNLIQIDQPNQFPMESRDYYLKGKDDKILTIYKTFAKNVVKTLGATEQQADEQFNDVINFEIELANITMPLDQRRANREAQYNRVKVKELSTNFTSAIDWVRFIQTVFADVNISIEADHDLNIRAPDYVRKLGELIEKTSKRTLQNYGVWWCLTTTLYELLSQKFQVLRKDFNKALKGTNQEMARWRYCVNFINQNLGVSVGRLYVERYFRSESKDNALDMVYKVHRAFIDILQEVTWLGEQTKKVAQAKADAIREKIGYPDFILNDTALEKEYAGVRGTPDNFFVNVISITRAALLENLRQLHLPIDRDRWSTPPVTVNAYYHPSKNIIMFPAGILQPPFYHKDNPMYLNFGGIATIIGHEITHGFDDQGRLFDIDGNVNLWWSEDDVRNFLQKAECFVEQYGNYTVKEVRQNINGRQTLGENIADNGGIKQSYRAYTQWVNENGQEPLLPGINLNQDQLFFLNFAQSWCGSTRPELLVRWIRSFQHSPRRERVMGTLSNSVEFAAAYRCPPGSPMNPVKKCRIW